VDKLLDFLSRNQNFVIGDGAMGTMLHSAGLTSGGSPEEWNVERPDVLKGIHQAYVDAGSQIITTNSFGGNRYRLALHNHQDRVRELNLAAARIAREVADAATRSGGHEVLVAGDIGPSGEILAPLGTTTAEEVRDAFAEQAAALAEGGVDFFLIETMSALEEVTAAVEGIKSASDLPIAATMTFDTKFRTMMGVKPAQAVEALYNLGVVVLGANCGNGPDEIERIVTEMSAVKPTGVYLIAQSNAGLPKWENKQVHYDGTPEVMADYAVKMRALGVNVLGACCGSTPDHIRAMREALGL
jgi:5-methyltetrahydrofolate--homocysteine methyltransferase